MDRESLVRSRQDSFSRSQDNVFQQQDQKDSDYQTVFQQGMD
jgi:hypothetical protein